MSEATPYSPECFHCVQNKIFPGRGSRCPTSRTFQPDGVLNAALYLGGEDILY